MADKPERDACSRALTEAVLDARARSDWAALRALCHDEARLCTVAAPEDILPPDSFVQVLNRATNESVYAIDGMTVDPIDDDAALVSGQARYPLAGGGFGDGSRAWILTYKDGQLYRLHPFPTAAKARAAYAEHGLDLGVEEAGRSRPAPLAASIGA